MANVRGTAADLWRLRTPLLTSEFTMHRDTIDGVDMLVCTVGKTILHYECRCLENPHAMLTAHGLSGDGEWTWVIDPIDGTANFIAGLPTFAVSVGVLQHGRPVVGAIALPAQGALLHARLGGVTRRGSDAVRVAQPAARTRVAVIGAGAHRRLHVAPALLDDLLDTRWLGSTAFEMAMIAQGVFDFGLFDRTAIWDVAAGIVLVRQAGGLVLHPDAGTGTWESFAGFPVDPARLRHWDAPLLAGGPDLQDLGRSVSLR